VRRLAVSSAASFNIGKQKLGTGDYFCNPSYSGGRDQEDLGKKKKESWKTKLLVP
jgi:hypothetical protein